MVLMCLWTALACGTGPASEVRGARYFEEDGPPIVKAKCQNPADLPWLHEPTNILATHEALKKAGYPALLNGRGGGDGWLDFGAYAMQRSVVETARVLLEVRQGRRHDAYSDAFWARREAEQNGREAEQVLVELVSILGEGKDAAVDESVVDEHVYALARLELEAEDGVTPEERTDHIKVLMKLGLHQSAANIITGERSEYPYVPRELVGRELAVLTPAESYPKCVWLEDNTK